MFSDGVVEDFAAKVSWKEGLVVLAGHVARRGSPTVKEALADVSQKVYSRHPGDDDRLLLVCEA
jgi:hypothetical protein